MQYKALEYLYKELRRERKGLGHAEKRPGHTDEEIRNIHRKIDILEHVIGVVLAAADDGGSDGNNMRKGAFAERSD